MTDDTMALRSLLEKSPDADFLRELTGPRGDGYRRMIELCPGRTRRYAR
jgi:hypothetical protein